MNEKINITKMDGSNVEAELICGLENKNTNKRYLYYTLNEIVGSEPNSTVKIYVTKVKQDNPALNDAITEEDWGVLKGYMGDSLKGIVNPDIKYIPLNELSNPVSVSERAIAMPTSYDYIAKQKAMYLENASEAGSVEVLTQEPTPVQEPNIITEQELNASTEHAPTIEPAPVSQEPEIQLTAPETPVEMEAPNEPVVEVQPEPVPSETQVEISPTPFIEPQVNNSVVEEHTVNSVKLEPIDIASIETKYAEMINDINKLKEKEIEAAQRYNATLELNVMHIDQHANYIQKDLEDNAVTTEQPLNEQEVLTNEPSIQEPTNMSFPSIEPTPVTPIVPEPVQTSTQEIETNWFDVPTSN